MDKRTIFINNPTRQSKGHRDISQLWTTSRPRTSFISTFSILALSLSLLIEQVVAVDFESSAINTRSEGNSTSKFYWIDLEPTPDLIWHPCYRPLRRECARLSVPLNHLDNSNNTSKQGSIALIRIPSPLANSSFNQTDKPDSRYRGPILFNPGGPGHSGVDLVNEAGDSFAQTLGDQFDIVGFDPRGIARSTPKIMFFDPPGRGESEVWNAAVTGVIRDGVGDPFRNLTGEKGSTLEWAWAHAVTTNKQAEARGGDWLGNVNTEQTAYDMLSIVNAYGMEKLMYWGVSYGTVLGATFASLFPDKVERVILDGVVDADNYYATLWNNNLLDTPKAMDLFFETCHAAGESGCPLWATSPNLIKANVTRILEDLIANPIAFRNSTSYGIVDYPRVRGFLLTSLYSPYTYWPRLAQALRDLGSPQRDPKAMWDIIGTPTFRCACSGSCDDKDKREQEFETASQLEALPAIACSDGADLASSVSDARNFFDDFSRKSEWADVWSILHIQCYGWPKVQKGFQGPVGANTSAPLLFIGNTADPVTPLANAKKMSSRFPGSRLLTQDSSGHSSLNSPSNCTSAHVKEYFMSGNLPSEGTVCPVDFPPIPDRNWSISTGSNVNNGPTTGMDILGRDDEAIDDYTKAWKPYKFPVKPIF
ncbi:hypothetical protein NP233_g9158 [Leucocoprinus birnbaumii]|uniref:Uncharacterized protein n=1 Tax=Leucocoprinus birnbaumii TaxID=56174 RepID=A0AAD5VKW6_9AGAR|nr:hypothetical protein NP233_g9158 [Leucocoprinus birnbaumii]